MITIKITNRQEEAIRAAWMYLSGIQFDEVEDKEYIRDHKELEKIYYKIQEAKEKK